jgi:hypothetical protein
MQAKDSSSEVAVTLTPAQAKLIADTVRIDLATRWQEEWLSPVPCREGLERARALIDQYDDELERLEWGEPRGEVKLECERDRLAALARELLEAGEEWVVAPGPNTPRAQEKAREMIGAAMAINTALGTA